ncbi:MAG: hypothetical protein JRF40_00510 [Deltaproteobacteria bacterium]|nr:hypothetical protein [Deltaproteobacteria bacterium]
MSIQKCRIKSKPGENAIKAAIGATGAAAAATGSAMVWYGTAGILTKVGLVLGLVSPPVAIFAACGLGSAAICAAFARKQLRKPDEEWAESMLDD